MKHYYKIIKNFFKLGANNKKLIFHLALSGILRSLTILLIPYMAANIIEAATEQNYDLAFSYVWIFLCCSVVYVFCHHYNYKAYINNAAFIHNKLQQIIMKKISTYDPDYSRDMQKAFLLNAAINDTVVKQIPDKMVDFLSGAVNIIVTMIILATINPIVGAVTFMLVIISMLMLTKNMRIREHYAKIQYAKQDDMANLMGQVVEGYKEISSLDLKKDLKEYLESYQEGWKEAFMEKRKYNDRVYVLIPMILGFGKIALYAISAMLILRGSFSAAILVLIVGYYENVESQFAKLDDILYKISVDAVSVKRLHQVLSYRTKHMPNFGDNDNDNIKGKVEFRNVYFTHERRTLARDLNFVIQPNSFVAIVGKSGSGKSTIFRLLLRLFKPTRGKIMIDDEDIYNYTKDVYSTNVSIVTQKPFIFDMTIRENLSLIDANHENQIEACKTVGIHEDISKMKEGYNTNLVSDAANLSSGQKQLLAFARTLLSKSEVLLFDEVTSSLDDHTSKQVVRIMDKLKKDHTIIMITHKPDLMKMADEIIVVDKAKIVGRGTHEELMKNNEYYQTLQK